MLYDDPAQDPQVQRLYHMKVMIDAVLARIIPDPVDEWRHADATTLIVETTTRRAFIVRAVGSDGWRVTEMAAFAYLKGQGNG